MEAKGPNKFEASQDSVSVSSPHRREHEADDPNTAQRVSFYRFRTPRRLYGFVFSAGSS